MDAEAEEEEAVRAADAEVAAAAPSGAEPSEAGSPAVSAEALAAVPAAVKERLRAALQSAMLGDLLEAARESLAVWQWVARRPPSPLPFKLSLNPVPSPPRRPRRAAARLARGADAAVAARCRPRCRSAATAGSQGDELRRESKGCAASAEVGRRADAAVERDAIELRRSGEGGGGGRRRSDAAVGRRPLFAAVEHTQASEAPACDAAVLTRGVATLHPSWGGRSVGVDRRRSRRLSRQRRASEGGEFVGAAAGSGGGARPAARLAQARRSSSGAP